MERNWDEDDEAELAGLVDGDDENRHVVELPKLPTSVWKGYCFRWEPEDKFVYNLLAKNIPFHVTLAPKLLIFSFFLLLLLLLCNDFIDLVKKHIS